MSIYWNLMYIGLANSNIVWFACGFKRNWVSYWNIRKKVWLNHLLLSLLRHSLILHGREIRLIKLLTLLNMLWNHLSVWNKWGHLLLRILVNYNDLLLLVLRGL